MRNRRMREKLEAGDCLDVLAEGEELAPGLYRLRRFLEGVDYCDAAREAWIWSIGQHVSTGEIIAATDARFYQNPEYVCLFLR